MFFISNEAPKVAADLVYQRLSAAAYQGHAIVKSAVKSIGYEFVEHVADATSGADAIVVRNDTEVVVAFRGTQRNYADIITDLKFKREPAVMMQGKDCVPVHRGFLAQWRAIKEDLHIVVSAAMADHHTPLKVTGHSLGGALAVLAAIDWNWVEDCITFGAPRVGCDEIKQAIRRNSILHRRYVYGADIVPIVPLLAMGYRHDCRPIYLTRKYRAIRNCSLPREFLGRSRALLSLDWSAGWSICPVPSRMFTDHRIGEYGHAMGQCPQ